MRPLEIPESNLPNIARLSRDNDGVALLAVVEAYRDELLKGLVAERDATLTARFQGAVQAVNEIIDGIKGASESLSIQREHSARPQRNTTY